MQCVLLIFANMKKLSQTIIGATLILDVAVVFTFGLAVIFSYEDGSRLPETTFVRKAPEGRVAGETIVICPSTANVGINAPTGGTIINSETFHIKAATTHNIPSSTLMYFVYPTSVSPFYNWIPATFISITDTSMYEWEADVNITNNQILKGPFVFHAEGYDSMGNCIAKSNDRGITINFTSSNTLPAPTINIMSPQSRDTLAGPQATVIGEIANLSIATQIQEAKLIILNNETVVGNPYDAQIFDTDNPFKRRSIFDSTVIDNGGYNLKIFVHYLDSNNTLKFIESPSISININNPDTTTTDTSTTETSAPPDTNTMTVNSATIISPVSLAILRTRDNPLAAKTSTAVSSLKFIVHKSDEPADWVMPINATTTDQINWAGNWNLTDFKDGVYDIRAVIQNQTAESPAIQAVVQKFSSVWINPQPLQKISGEVSVKADISGIYVKDGITPVKGVKAYFYQTNTQMPYTEFYNEQLYQIPNTREWRLYDGTKKAEKLWKTSNSSNGKYRLFIKVINESINTSNIWFPTEPIFVEINNQQAVLPSNNNANTSVSAVNNNKNISIAANTNVSATNSANNAAVSVDINNENTNSSAGAAVAPEKIDSDQDLLSDEDERARGTDPNSVDTDNDGLTDFVEIDKYKTDPLKKDTDGDGYLDGEEVQSGHDPLKPPTDATAAAPLKLKPVEEPKNSEKPISEELVVEKIDNKPLPDPDINSPESSAENKIVLSGKGPANTILTLFIYSNDPIVVTVRTNENGEWIYELDKTLEDGEHEVYATITDDTGKIESTSSPMRFLVKQARAETIPERADTGVDSIPGSSSTNLYLLISGIMVFIAIVAGFIIALRRKRGDTNQIT